MLFGRSKIIPCVLFRKLSKIGYEEEFNICKSVFPTYSLRSEVPKNSLVIGRYSTLPFYSELWKDLQSKNSQLLNSPEQHKWIADFEWYNELKDYTPKTYFDFQSLNEGEFVVKGKTSSKKLSWNKEMFCSSKQEAISKGLDLLQDGLISTQGIVIRDYVPLLTLDHGLNGLPITEEYRFFYWKNYMLTWYYYWNDFTDQKPVVLTAAKETPNRKTLFELSKLILFSSDIAKICMKFANAFVLDIAKTQSGDWILVEVNDLQQSGLCSDLEKVNSMYMRLKEVIGK